MPKTANREITDAFIRHQIWLNRYSGHLTKQILEELKESSILAEKEIERLQKKIILAKLPSVTNKIQKIRLATWDKSWKKYIQEIKKFSKGETQHIKKIFTNYAPVHLTLNIPGQDTLKKIIQATITGNKNIDDWMKATTKADIKKITRITRYGVASGLTTKDISTMIQQQNIIAKKYTDSVSRTFVKHISSSIRREIAVENEDIFENERFVATLDSRTTLICSTKDGEIYPIGEGPELPLHFGCRSELVPTLNGERLGNRPVKNTSEKQALKSYAKKHRISNYKDIKKTRKVKEYIRNFIRKETGVVPSKVNYAAWFKTQTKEMQNEILGKKRANLYRENKLKLNQFIDKTGKTLTLDELSKKYNLDI